MEKEIAYENWPTVVKVSTALAHKKFVSKGYKPILFMGWMLALMGLFEAVYKFYNVEELIYKHFSLALSYLLVGVATIISAYSIKWIANNSSWEERFKQKSSIAHKIVYLIVTAILIGSIVMIYLN